MCQAWSLCDRGKSRTRVLVFIVSHEQGCRGRLRIWPIGIATPHSTVVVKHLKMKQVILIILVFFGIQTTNAQVITKIDSLEITNKVNDWHQA